MNFDKQLFNFSKSSDYEFIFKDSFLKKIHCHSSILQSKCPSLFYKFADTDQPVLIVDSTYSEFLDFIRFIYTNECDITVTNVAELIRLGQYYSVEALRVKCFEFMARMCINPILSLNIDFNVIFLGDLRTWQYRDVKMNNLQTRLSVSSCILLRNITIGVSVPSRNIKMTLRNENGRLMCEKYVTLKETQWQFIRFGRPILLLKNKNFILDVEYEESERLNFWCCAPTSKLPVSIVSPGSVEFKFHEISPIMWQIGFSPA